MVDEKQLAPALWSGKIQAVLDVWESEPNIDAELLAKSAIGTPHIAGYSFDGKAKGAQMVYEAACRFLGEQPCWQAELVMPAPTVPTIKVDAQGDNDQRAIFEVVKRIYDVEADDHRMRELLTLPKDSQGRHFDNLPNT